MQTLIDQIKDIKGLEYKTVDVVQEYRNNEVDTHIEIKFNNEVNVDDLLKALKIIYDWENELDIKDTDSKEKKEEKEKIKRPTVFLSLKGLDTELLAEGLRYSMHRKDLKNPIMLMNIFNIIRVYMNSNKQWLENEDVYMTSLPQNTDIRQILRDDIIQLKTEFTFYFLSILKSYNKMEYTPQDNCEELPNMFKAYFGISDLLTICGIFNDAQPINTGDLKLIQNSFEYVSNILEKSSIGFGFMEQFLNQIYDKEAKENADTKTE